MIATKQSDQKSEIEELRHKEREYRSGYRNGILASIEKVQNAADRARLREYLGKL